MTFEKSVNPEPLAKLSAAPHARRLVLALSAGGILAVLVLGFIGYRFVASQQSALDRQTAVRPTSISTPSITPTPTATPSPTPVPGGTLFISEKLGISFSYARQASGATFITQEVGDTVHLYAEGSATTTGQSVQVLAKDPADSIEQAIVKNVLKGYDPQDCPIQLNPNSANVLPSAQQRPASFQTAAIHWTEANLGSNFVPADSSVCPDHYVAVNGIRYFLVDQAHPNKLLFFDIGQWSLPASADAEDQLVWQDTIRVL